MLSCIGVALSVTQNIFKGEPAWDINISANGLISLAERLSTDHPKFGFSPAVRRSYNLLPTSTLWSWMMILNLRAECGAVCVVRVLPDNISTASFRALSVACNWITAHNARIEGEKA